MKSLRKKKLSLDVNTNYLKCSPSSQSVGSPVKSLIEESKHYFEDDSSVIVEEPLEMIQQRQEQIRLLLERREADRQQKIIDDSKSFKTKGITPRKIFQRVVIDNNKLVQQGRITLEPKNRKNSVKMPQGPDGYIRVKDISSQNIKHSLASLLTSEGGSRLLLDASQRIGKKKVFERKHHSLGSCKNISLDKSYVSEEQANQFQATLQKLSTKNPGSSRASDIVNGYKKSSRVQSTADDVVSALDYSLKKPPTPEKKKMIGVGFMRQLTNLRLPEIKKVPKVSQTEKVLTDSVLFQYAYLDKLLKDCKDERGPGRSFKSALSQFDKQEQETKQYLQKLQTELKYANDVNGKDKILFEESFFGEQGIAEFKQNRSQCASYIREHLGRKYSTLKQGVGPLWKAKTNNIYSKDFTRRFPHLK